ncbi:MAG: response regulator [Nitrospira sp.]|nr:MAG: response regulator [Nitrospira sp.]
MATILLVEDHAVLRKALRRQLEADGYRVVEAADGNEAIHCWRMHAPDVIITDFQLPHLNGREVIQVVSAQQPALPIILMSGGMDEQLRVCILHQYPSVRYLAKDVVSTQLCSSVRDALL